MIWQWLDPTIVIRYRLSLFVAIGNKVEVSSSIFDITAHNNWILLEGGPWTASIRGEAVAVQFGGRGLLVATLLSDSTRPSSRGPDSLLELATGSFAGSFPDGGIISDWLWVTRLREDPVDIPLDELPMLVRFRDPKERQSAERVEPRDLARAFVSDAQLIRATVQIVPHGIWPFSLLRLGAPQWLFGVPVSNTLNQTLPWLDSWDDKSHLLDRPNGASKLAPEYALNREDFERGETKK